MSIWSWVKRRRLDEEDFQEELRAHLAIAEKERMADGADAKSAHYAARKELGNLTLTTEAARRVYVPWWMEALRDQANDVRYAVRGLARSPGFSLAVVLVLTLGIGLNAAVFTMLKSLALTPFAGVDGSARLAVVYGETSAGRAVSLSYPDYQQLRNHRAFAGLFGTASARVNLGRGRGARQIWAELVTGNYFEVLGVRAERGRTLLPSDETAPGRDAVVVLSEGLWRRDFDADPQIVGRTVEINEQFLTVVGIADRRFHGTTVVYDVEAYVPVTMAPLLGFSFGSSEKTPSGILADRRAAIFDPHGYLRPGTTRVQAEAQMGAAWAELSRERPLTDAAQRLRVVPLRRAPGRATGFALPTLSVLIVTGLLVLTIACANIAGLVLVRGVSRRGEIAVRLALGASRTRIVRMLAVENLVLAVPGAILGVLLASQAIPVLVSYTEWLATPDRIFFNAEVDPLVIGFAALVACGSAVAFGFVPALQSSRADLVSVINEDASPRGAGRGRLRAGLVVAQVAVSLLLLVGAGLVTRSLEAARRADPGFDARQVSAVSVNLRQNAYDATRGAVFFRKLLDAARSAPGVESATLAQRTPLALLEARAERVTIDGYAPRKGEDLAFISNTVAPGYFRTLRIGLAAGRDFEDSDDAASGPVAIVNDTLAARFWGDAANAVGKRIRLGEGDWRTVIGVAADVKYLKIDEAPRPYVYLPLFQVYRPAMILHTRSAAPVPALVAQARAMIEALDRELPILYARPMTETTRGALLFLELGATMLFVFGAAGMALAAMGTYGLVSYSVEQSTREVGVRMALGATGLAIVRGFLGRGLRLGVLGAALGAVVALALSRFLGSVLFGVTATDATSYATGLALVLGAVAAATVVPAWRAARTNPLIALRHQ
jgi:predicted permease